MLQKNITPRSINANFVAIQGSYWTSAVAYFMFAVVFLQYRGLTNTQIGFAMSSSAVGAIVLQMLLSDFSDKNQGIPLKKIIALVYAVIVLMSAVLSLVPYPIAIIMTAYIVGQTCVSSINSLLSALFMQIQNAGLKINFGLSRGTGSVLFAFASYFLGVAVEKNSPEILFPLQMVLSLLAIIFIIIIPRPEKISGEHPDKVQEESRRSIVTMLKENPTFIMLMISMVVTFTGQSYFGFFINIIRNVGGNTANLGFALFIYAIVEILPMLLSVKLLDKFGPKKLMVVAVFAFFVKVLLVETASSVGLIYAISVTNIFSNGIFFFASVYFINEIVRPNERTRGQALIGLCSFGGLGTVIGASISGMLLDHYGIDAMMLFCIICTFAGFLLMLVTSFLHKKHFMKQV